MVLFTSSTMICQTLTHTFGRLSQFGAPVVVGDDVEGGGGLRLSLGVPRDNAHLPAVRLPGARDLQVVHHAVVLHLVTCTLQHT